MTPEILARFDQIIIAVRALRVQRWCLEWPRGHAERPTVPRFVTEFERQHGPAPDSAERILEAFQPDARKRSIPEALGAQSGPEILGLSGPKTSP